MITGINPLAYKQPIDTKRYELSPARVVIARSAATKQSIFFHWFSKLQMKMDCFTSFAMTGAGKQ
jgi:hypothetical protein